MSTTKEYMAFVGDQLADIPNVRWRKMFGEYMVYVEDRPVLLVCDNCVIVKKLPELAALMEGAAEGYPYEVAKLHYILDIENRELVRPVLDILVQVTPVPKKRKAAGKKNT